MASPDELTIERATSGDLREIVALANALRQEEPEFCGPANNATASDEVFQTLLSDPSLGLIWAAKAGGTVVGYLAVLYSYSLELGGRVAFFDELFVMPTHRRHGIGRQLLALAESRLCEIGITTVLLEVSPRNPLASRLYREIGFEFRPYGLMKKSIVKL